MTKPRVVFGISHPTLGIPREFFTPSLHQHRCLQPHLAEPQLLLLSCLFGLYLIINS